MKIFIGDLLKLHFEQLTTSRTSLKILGAPHLWQSFVNVRKTLHPQGPTDRSGRHYKQTSLFLYQTQSHHN